MNAKYVLLTAAKDEEACIEEVIELVVRQTILPVMWFIMDDGSVDTTASIVEKYAAKYSFIHLNSARTRGGRNFGSQYKAIMAGYELARQLTFDFVAIQDADQAPEQVYYYESILKEFQLHPKLGVASGFVYERPRGVWECRRCNSLDSCAASAVFRRSCFEQIGGYTPLHYGGSDWLIQINAKMAGWSILTRPDLHVLHYRPTSSAGGLCRGIFQQGMIDGSFGSNPVFQFFKCVRRMSIRPSDLWYSAVLFSGYVWWKITGRAPLLPQDTVTFLRRQQMAKVARFVRSLFGISQSELDQ
jgi:poly-beta-1,6-N-acetyl-D-glucosamine synthase